jgi:hypothetical protein
MAGPAIRARAGIRSCRAETLGTATCNQFLSTHTRVAGCIRGSPRPRHGSSVIDRRTTTGLDIGHDHARALAAVPAGRYGSLCVTDRRTALEPAAVGQRAPRERALEGSRVGPHARPGRRAIAADLARLGLPAARLVTSDLVRAVETAQIVGEGSGSSPSWTPASASNTSGNWRVAATRTPGRGPSFTTGRTPSCRWRGVSRSGRCAAAWPQSWRTSLLGLPRC